MLPDRVSNPGPLTYESGALPIALCSPAPVVRNVNFFLNSQKKKNKIQLSPIALRMAKTLQSFGHSECNRVIIRFSEKKYPHPA